MNSILPVEIRSFRSIKELSSFIDIYIGWYEDILKDYNQNLGELLRKPDGTQDEELLKKLSENMQREQEPKKQGKKDKKSEPSSSGNWFDFRGLMFSANSKSMAEIFFEAIDVIKKNFERLKEVKALIEEIQKIGFSADLVYSIYFINGIPQKIYIEKESSVKPKYRLEINLSTGDKEEKGAEETIGAMNPEPSKSVSPENQPSAPA
jgi:hypothetical protein